MMCYQSWKKIYIFINHIIEVISMSNQPMELIHQSQPTNSTLKLVDLTPMTV